MGEPQIDDTINNVGSSDFALKEFTNKALENIRKSSSTKQIVIGSLSGWTTGCITIKVGKTAAFILGGGIILIQVANQNGYIKMDWDKMKKTAEEASKKIESRYNKNNWLPYLIDFSCTNGCFAAAFIGGFLIGLSS